MRAMNALIFATFAGVATFAAQNELFPPRLHAAPFVVPNTPNWRREAIDTFPGGAKVDHMVARLSDRLELSHAQARQFHALLDREREQTLALLVAGPPNLTRDQFVSQHERIWESTRAKLDALLTPDQLEIAQEFAPGKRA